MAQKVIKDELLFPIMDYLSTKPFREVTGFIQALQQLPEFKPVASAQAAVNTDSIHGQNPVGARVMAAEATKQTPPAINDVKPLVTPIAPIEADPASTVETK